ncbi:hypothetical protein FRC07_001974 [Ceratobasidium sp. 392]|nr:hypothetical protein FRC07_001974 [Ceratobasidium sp. 392]
MPIPFAEVPLPSSNTEMDNQAWPSEPSSTPSTAVAPAKSTTLAFHESSKLMIIAARIIDVIRYKESNDLEEHVIINMQSVLFSYSTAAINLIESKTSLRLDTWFNALPEKLLVWARSTSPLPHLIVLHICYWWLLIVLHQSLYPEEQQPQLAGSGKDKDKTVPAQRMPITDLSIKMCDRAAHKIVQLINMFDDQHGLRFFPRNMIEAISACGTALLREYALAPVAANKKRATAANGANTCISALRTISTTWPCATARADDLESRLQGRFGAIVPVPQVDGSTTDDGGEDQGNNSVEDDYSDSSSAFYQYMHDWSHLPDASPGMGSELSFEYAEDVDSEGI